MTSPHSNSSSLLRVQNLCKRFPVHEGILQRPRRYVTAVDNVSFDVPRGTTYALVGESGSGKTTTARLILRLLEPTSGSVQFDGFSVFDADARTLRALRRRMQIVFQDPFSSLNPRMTVHRMLSEVLRVHKVCSRHEVDAHVAMLLERVGLPPEAANRYPHEFSGGQRQRIGIARALAVNPELIVADEPVSSLDVSVQAQLLNLLRELQQSLGLTYVFISHDLGVVRYLADRVGVMHQGRLVEEGPTEEIFADPKDDYTQRLLDAIPRLHRSGRFQPPRFPDRAM